MADHLDRLKAALTDRFTIERELGAGGMATVYLAEDLKHHRKVAVKVLRPELAAVLGAERFLREVEVTSRLDHPHILPLFDSGEARGFFYYVMPHVEGESLRTRLNRESRLPVQEALDIARAVATALGYAHQHGVVHRDVKPENIMLSAGVARVADFGIAKGIAVAGGDALTDTGLVLGTVQYMSPEQATGEREVDGRSDVYALGCVLYEMLGGQPPFGGTTIEAVIRQQIAVQPRALTDIRPGLPPSVAAIVTRCLAKAPEERYASASQVAEALRDVLSSDTPARQPSRKPAANVLFALGLAIAALLVVVFVIPGQRGTASSPSDEAAPGVAILPFRVTPGLERWHEGMVDVLSTNLDVVPGIRGIHSGTVLARWREEVADGEEADFEAAVRVAGRTGARWAVVGTAFQTSHQLRFSATIYDLEAAGEAAQLRVEGSADSALALSERLSVDIARQLVARDRTLAARFGSGVPPLTTSMAALAAYLEGEALVRRDRWGDAIDVYDRAIRADPTFALAYMRIGDAIAWAGPMLVQGRQAADMYRLARRHADRLSERDRIRIEIKAESGAIGGRSHHVDALHRATRRYPDDVELWNMLGETMMHGVGGSKMLSMEEVDSIYSRILALAPSFAPYYGHSVDLAINVGDGARAYELLEVQRRLSGGQGTIYLGHAVSVPLVFGDSAAQASAGEATWSLEGGGNRPFLYAAGSLWAPHTLAAKEAMGTIAWARSETTPALAEPLVLGGAWIVRVLIHRGKTVAALLALDDPHMPEVRRVTDLYEMHLDHLPVPDDRLEREFAAALELGLDWRQLLVGGAYAAERGWWQRHDRGIVQARARADELSAMPTGQMFDFVADALTAYGGWLRGNDPDSAVRQLEDLDDEWSHLCRDVCFLNRRWIADIHASTGNYNRAIQYLRSLWNWGLADTYRHFLLGGLYEQVGDVVSARREYEQFLIAWAEADPDLVQLAQARAALERLPARRN